MKASCSQLMLASSHASPMDFLSERSIALVDSLSGCRLLSWLGNEGHPDRALEVFNWLEGRREYVTEVCILYTRLASMFARQKGGLETAMRLFDRMQARGIRPDTVAFNSAITVASEHPPIPRALYSCHMCAVSWASREDWYNVTRAEIPL